MKDIYVPVVMFLCSLAFLSCSEKKKNDDIIATKPVVVAPKAPTKMQVYERTENVDWVGGRFKIKISRQVDEQASVFADDNGNKCHDNIVTLVVTRGDGSEFFRREFRKSSFSNYVDGSYLAKSTILGIAFDRVEGNNLLFVASVGCPDQLSDDFIPIRLSLSKSGDLSMKRAEDLDTSATPSAEDDEGV